MNGNGLTPGTGGSASQVTSSEDARFAKATREKISMLLLSVCEAMDEAQGFGLKVTFTLGIDQFGRNRIGEINIMRPL